MAIAPRRLGYAFGVFALALAALLVGCNAPGVSTSPTSAPPTQIIGANAAPPQRITIAEPQAGAQVGSPVRVRGTTRTFPQAGNLIYRIFDAQGSQVGSGALRVRGQVGLPGTFDATLPFTATVTGAGRIEIIEPSAAGGGTLGTVAVVLQSSGGSSNGQIVPPLAPTATAQPDQQPQQITIDTPPPGTQVGSPVVLTGRTVRYPFQGKLTYRVVDSTNKQIGQGAFPLSGAPDQPASFNVALTFDLPPLGGAVRVDVYDQNATNGVIVAASSLNLATVASIPQQITIETPAPGTQVGSPLVITGRTVRYPFQGSLAYAVLDVNSGAQLGGGIFPVSGPEGQPTTFNAALDFNLPTNGGPVRVEIFDQDGDYGAVVARSTVTLNVGAPPPVQQVITLDSPPPNVQVFSPIVVSGRTARYPDSGRLTYRVRAANGADLGGGQFPLTGALGQPASFSAVLTFSIPADGGGITLTVLDLAANGSVAASAALDLLLPGAPPPPPPTSAPPTQQVISLTSPPAGAQVGSPVVITGNLARPAASGQLAYRVRAANGAQLGGGSFPVNGLSFAASLNFNPPPNGGTITAEILEQNPNGSVAASAELILLVAPPSPTIAQPQIQTPTIRQQIIIETLLPLFVRFVTFVVISSRLL